MQLAVLFALVAVAWAGSAQYIDKEYLVGLRPGSDVNKFLARNSNIEMKKSYDLGRTVLLYVRAEDADIEIVKFSPYVKYVERNGIAHTAQCESQNANGCWGLDRTDQREQLGYTDPEDSSAVYNWGESTGAGTDAFILDTGIYIAHTDFGGRAVWAYTADGITSGDDDGNGHGTHCAGTIGSNSYGLAKATTLNAVKVLEDSGSGPWSAVIDGMQWVQANSPNPSVVSMSLSGGGTDSVDDAVAALVASGVTTVVAAGNSDANACLYSPARAAEAITVCATDVGDNSASFTNYGTCVDICAPGVDVKSTWNDDGTNTISGTSMATPHVAGVVVRYLSANPTATPDDVLTWLTRTATADAITWCCPNHDTSPNRLLFADCAI